MLVDPCHALADASDDPFHIVEVTKVIPGHVAHRAVLLSDSLAPARPDTSAYTAIQHKKELTALHRTKTRSRAIRDHMESTICHPTQVNVSRLAIFDDSHLIPL